MKAQSLYHFSISTRNDAVNSSSYICGVDLYSERDGRTHSHTKEEVICHNIMLADGAPASYQDRETLWNAAESAERQFDGRSCRRFEMSLPNEFNKEDAVSCVEEFCHNLTRQGMCVEYAIHFNEVDSEKGRDVDNLHAHIQATTRPIDSDGHFTNKRSSLFVCRDEAGNEIFCKAKDIPTGFEKIPVLREGFTDPGRLMFKVINEDGSKTRVFFESKDDAPDNAVFVGYENQKTRAGNRMIWEKIYTHETTWDSTDQLLDWRKQWEIVLNDAIDKYNDRVEAEGGYTIGHADCRSYEDQAIEILDIIEAKQAGITLTDYEQDLYEASDYLLSRIPEPEYHIAQAHFYDRPDYADIWINNIDYTDYNEKKGRLRTLISEIKILDWICGCVDRIEAMVDSAAEKIETFFEKIDAWLTGHTETTLPDLYDESVDSNDVEIYSEDRITDIDIDNIGLVDQDDLWPDL